MLVNNPTLGDKFDQFYGVGAAKQILAQMNGGQPEPEPEDDYLNLMKNTMSEGNAQEVLPFGLFDASSAIICKHLLVPLLFLLVPLFGFGLRVYTRKHCKTAIVIMNVWLPQLSHTCCLPNFCCISTA